MNMIMNAYERNAAQPLAALMEWAEWIMNAYEWVADGGAGSH
jgi:hypothetical protein